jgi:hypothetical protein
MLTTFLAFALICLCGFWTLPLRTAASLTYFGGWLLLPVARYPESTITTNYFTVDVIGVALPSNLGITKAVVIPLVTLLGMTLRAPQFWTKIRLTWLDYCLFAFCLWPISLSLASDISIQRSSAYSIYLFASWAGSWLIGRLIFFGEKGRLTLTQAIAWSGVALFPASLIEGIIGPCIYSPVYGVHAFLLEGSSRYIGHRPLAFFEHGNQYGIWIAMSAFGWLILLRNDNAGRRFEKVGTAWTTIAAIASQSVGAIALLAFGTLAMFTPIQRIRRFGVIAGLLIAILIGIYASGAVPIERIAKNTVFGQKMVSLLRLSGRTTIGYRIHRDQIAIPLIYKAPFTGYGSWDWWRPLGSHPWGLPLLIAGQFGIIGLALSTTAIGGAAVLAIQSNVSLCFPLAIVVVIAMVDAALNSYIYFPAIVVAGAIISTQTSTAPSPS